MILLEIDSKGVAVRKLEGDAPRPIHMDRKARRLEASQGRAVAGLLQSSYCNVSEFVFEEIGNLRFRQNDYRTRYFTRGFEETEWAAAHIP